MRNLMHSYREIPLPLKASIWFILCNILLKGISFFTAPLFARLLSTDEYGKLTLFSSYEQIIVILATWEVGLSPTQRGILKYEDRKQNYVSSVILFSMFTSLIISIFIFLFRDQISDFTDISIRLLGYMSLYTFVYTAYTSWMTENKLFYNYKIVSVVTVAMTSLQIISALIAVMFVDATAEIKLLFTMIPMIITSFIICILRFKPISLIQNWKETKKYLKFILTFTWPLLLHSLSYLVLSQADRIMIGKMVGNSEAGLYGVAYTISSVVIIVQNAVLQVLSPWIYHKMYAQEYEQIRNRSKVILLLVCVVYIIFILLAPDVIIGLYPEYYWEGIWCIPPIAMGVFFMFMYSLFVAVEECLDQTKYIAIVSTTCAMLNVLLNYIGIKLFGYIACAYTTLFCYILFAVSHYFFMTKVLGKKGRCVKIFDGKFFLFISIIMVCLMIGMTFTYNIRILRYFIVAMIFCICIMFRNKITTIINELMKA